MRSIESLAPEGTEFTALANAREYGASATILAIAQKMLDDTRNKEDAQGVNDVDISKDFRYSKGKIAALKEILALPAAALEFINAAETHQKAH